MTAAAATSFVYEAQTPDGLAIRGAVDAANFEEARNNLAAIQLRVLRLEAAEKPARPRPMRGSDFVIFNQQLAQLAQAGMPIEHGLRMIARDVRSRRLSRTIEHVAEELERGKPLAEAFGTYRGQFPSFYGQIMEAGIKSGNLAGVPFSLGRHLDLIQRLRGMLWRAAAYPLMVMLFVIAVMGFVCVTLLPKFEEIFTDFYTKLPFFTQFMLDSREWILVAVVAAIALMLASPLLWHLLHLLRLDRQLIDHVVLPLPLIGQVMRGSMVARWCDTVKLCVMSGLDLPHSILLAGDAIGSPLVRKDGQQIVAAIESGRPASESVSPQVLTPTVCATFDLVQGQDALASALETLADMYQQQAELRMSVAQVVVGPILVAFMAGFIGLLVLAMFLPMVKLINSVM